MRPPEKITATNAQYIKLGEGGEYQKISFSDGTLRLGFYEVPHEFALNGDMEKIRNIYLGKTAGVATNYAKQVLAFYNPDQNRIWFTFADGFLWWCQAKPDVEFLGSDKAMCPQGSRLRRTQNGWSNKSVNGNFLRIAELNGNLTKVAAFKGAICSIDSKRADYLRRKINDEPIPEIAEAEDAKKNLIQSIKHLITLLNPKDFEIFVDLIFSKSGWQRITVVGDGLETSDIELILPSTGERAMVQVKSATNQQQLNEYIEAFSRWQLDRLFYVFHTVQGNALMTTNPKVSLIDVEALADMCLKSGLVDWIIRKAG